MNKRLAILVYILILIIGSCFLLYHFKGKILTKNKPVKANILIIEGWLPDYTLDIIPKMVDLSGYSTIIATAMKHEKRDEEFPTYQFETKKGIFITNGAGYLKKSALSRLNTNDTIRTIKIFSHGEKVAGIFPHFLLYINDSLAGGGYSGETNMLPKVISVNISGYQLRKLLIFFNNDNAPAGYDRNLWIDSIKINNQCFTGNNDFAWILEQDVSKYLQIESDSKNTARYLAFLGVSQPIIILDTMTIARNRTRAFAVKCKKWLNSNYKDKNYSINVISIDYHSRRSYNTFKSVVKGKEIGIISLPFIDKEIPDMKTSFFEKYRFIIKQYVSLILNYAY